MKINDLVKRAHEMAVSKGFYEKPNTFGEQLALVHSEVSEALEAYRERGLDKWYREDGKPEGVESELADVVIRVADIAGHLGIDLQAIVDEKMRFNANRPHKHGKRF